MIERVTIAPMAESVKMVKISIKNYERLQKYGVAGESINTALTKLLDSHIPIDNQKLQDLQIRYTDQIKRYDALMAEVTKFKKELYDNHKSP